MSTGYVLIKELIINFTNNYLHNKNSFPANDYLFKANNRNTKKRCLSLTIKTQERRQRRQLVFLLLFMNIFHTFL